MSDDTPIPGFDLAAYLDGLRWSSDATEHEKTLVIGNLRALHAAIARALPTVQELQRMVLERNKVINEETRLRIEAECDATDLLAAIIKIRNDSYDQPTNDELDALIAKARGSSSGTETQR